MSCHTGSHNLLPRIMVAPKKKKKKKKRMDHQTAIMDNVLLAEYLVPDDDLVDLVVINDNENDNNDNNNDGNDNNEET